MCIPCSIIIKTISLFFASLSLSLLCLSLSLSLYAHLPPPIRQVLRRALGQFVVYFERFEALITAHYRAPSILGALVPLHVVRFQVKKYDLVGQGQPQAQLQ